MILPRGDNGLARGLNAANVLTEIYRRGSISRADLVRTLGLSPSTVSVVTADLIQRNFISEVRYEGGSGVGRRPILLAPNPSSWIILAFHLGDAGDIQAGVFNLALNMLKRIRLDGVDLKSPQGSPRLSEIVADLTRACGKTREEVLGIGIAAPGLVDAEKGTIIFSAHRGWRDFPIAQTLKAAVGIPVFMENATNLAALAEHERGSAKGIDNLVYINFGQAIGAGIVIGGQIYRRGYGPAGEFGHTLVDLNGPRCTCGARGCVEVYASGKAMVEAFSQEKINLGGSSGTSGLGQFLEYVGKGDSTATAILERASRYLGAGIVNLVNLLGPDAVVIGGEIPDKAPAVVGMVEEELTKLSLARFSRPVDVLASSFGVDGSLIGAALNVIRCSFSPI